MEVLGAERDLDLQVHEEIDALDLVSLEPHVTQWSALPRDVQRLWLGLVVARTRAVKCVAALSEKQRARVRSIISRYPPWATAHQPGHVHGLRLNHDPKDGTWTNDARRLRTLLREGPLVPRQPQRTSKSAVTRAKPAEDDDSSDDSDRRIDPAWPLWPIVRGRRAVIVGGDPREPNRARLERLFELSSLEWPDIAGPRKVDSVVARIKRGTVDLVVVVGGLVDHKQSAPIIAAAKDSRIAWALAESYGVASVKAGLERFLAQPR
jgi:hypothetical protein